MGFSLVRLMRHVLTAAAYSVLGALVMLIIAFVLYLNNRGDLHVWHLADLDQEFTVDSELAGFEDYLALEDRLFRQLDALIDTQDSPIRYQEIHRYSRNSLSDPQRWAPNWNRSFVLSAARPKAGVLLLHGMSDSPYSLRHLGKRLHAAGASVVGLRVPGHGTAPSGLVEVTWQDMDAAVRLAMRYLAEHSGGKPLYVVGYSNGAALAVHYALNTIEDETLPPVERLVVLSPAIGVTPVAALAVWQARLGHLLGLDKLAWTSILPEYDPFKYGSFAVNAGHVVYQLTNEIQQGLTTLGNGGRLEDFPPILAFSSVVDATVSTPALIRGLFDRLPEGGHELVLFDINHQADMKPLMQWDPSELIQALQSDQDRTFTLSMVSNEESASERVLVHSRHPGESTGGRTDLGLSWPQNLYSLSHVALPFPPHDSLYGGHPSENSPGIHLGDISLHGERGVLKISAAEILRIRWNPFYPYVEARVLEFLGLE